MEGTQTQPEPQPQTQSEATYVSHIFDPLVIGDPGDDVPSPQEVLEVVSILEGAGITFCVTQISALMYYGAPRVTSDRVLCVQNKDYERAVALFESRDDLLKPCGPLPLNSPTLLNHKYPRFKARGKIGFWQLVPESYSHFDCKPENIEWSLGGIPYPKLHLYVQRAIDTKDGMDLSEDWGEENLNLDGTTDTKWLEDYYQAFCADFRERGKDEQIWERSVRNKQRRLGWKYPPERYATRYRKHGSTDPRTRNRPGL
ncbi:hypothetical protein BDW59DRAFT_176662 [Aspergillus cavernicola]|uniref:Uncharacterized protein n=1 Tax=Aspergillus cavernicola TaxID=176166 RepID=A0ABR4HEL0_9EURO